jgi:drug/metabolite transporter (DMT)-like permease
MQIWIFLMLCNLLWAGNFISGKIATAEFPPFWISLLRWNIAVVILLPLAFWAQKINLKSIDRKTWFNLAAMGLCGIDLFTIFTYSALQYSSPVNVSLISTLTPAFAMLFAALVLKVRTYPRQYFGLLLAIFGVLIIITAGNLSTLLTMEFNRGDLLMLFADMSWVLYTAAGKNITTLPPIMTTALSTLLGVLFLLPFAPFIPLPVEAISRAGVASILYISLGASVCAFILWNFALQRVNLTTASISMNLIPLYTVAITLLLGETFKSSQLFGGLLVLVGICCISLPQRSSYSSDAAKTILGQKLLLHPLRLLTFLIGGKSL